MAAAVVRQILNLCPHHGSEAGVWRAFATSRGRNQVSYFEAVQRTHQLVFHYELQQLIDFGIDEAPAEHREFFCLQAGRTLGTAALEDTIYPLLGAVGEPQGSVQTGLVNIVRMYLQHYAEDEYLLTPEYSPHEVVLRIKEQSHERALAYFQHYGLDAAKCFRKNLQLIAGGLDSVLRALVRPYDPSGLRCLCTDAEGQIHLPVTEKSELAYDWLCGNLLQVLHRMQVSQQSDSHEREMEADLVIASPTMNETWDRVRRASRTDEPLLLLGESGTGKTFIAKKIHELSSRRNCPFINVGLTADIGSENLVQSTLFGHDRGSFTGATERKQGLFSLAHGGTILLDEIGDASPELQAKLLRVIETGTFRRLGGVEDIHVNVRIIAATHCDLEAMAGNGTFRQDLRFRLNVIAVRLPPLRERPEAIGALAQHLIRRINVKGPAKRLAPGLVEQLQLYPWPGNIRELDHALRYAAAMSDTDLIQLADLPSEIQDHLRGTSLVPVPVSTLLKTDSPIIDMDGLRRAIRSTDALALSREAQPCRFPAHIDYARKQYLTALIDALDGDLPVMGHFFDRGSEKTLRNLIRSFGLEEALQTARSRGSRSNKCP